jgi:predicted RecB family nuclease
VTLGETEVMGEIARYNEVDCRVMAEILDYLRRER